MVIVALAAGVNPHDFCFQMVIVALAAGVNPHDFIYSLCFRTCWVLGILLSDFLTWRTKVEEIWTVYNTPKCSVYSCCIITRQRNSKANKCSQHMSIHVQRIQHMGYHGLKALVFDPHTQSELDFYGFLMVINGHHMSSLADTCCPLHAQKITKARTNIFPVFIKSVPGIPNLLVTFPSASEFRTSWYGRLT